MPSTRSVFSGTIFVCDIHAFHKHGHCKRGKCRIDFLIYSFTWDFRVYGERKSPLHSDCIAVAENKRAYRSLSRFPELNQYADDARGNLHQMFLGHPACSYGSVIILIDRIYCSEREKLATDFIFENICFRARWQMKILRRAGIRSEKGKRPISYEVEKFYIWGRGDIKKRPNVAGKAIDDLLHGKKNRGFKTGVNLFLQYTRAKEMELFIIIFALF